MPQPEATRLPVRADLVGEFLERWEVPAIVSWTAWEYPIHETNPGLVVVQHASLPATRWPGIHPEGGLATGGCPSGYVETPAEPIVQALRLGGPRPS